MMKNLAPTKSLFELLTKETNGLCLDVVLFGINLEKRRYFHLHGRFQQTDFQENLWTSFWKLVFVSNCGWKGIGAWRVIEEFVTVKDVEVYDYTVLVTFIAFYFNYRFSYYFLIKEHYDSDY